MKKIIKVITLVLLVAVAFTIHSQSFAQGPPQPLEGSSHGADGDIPGGGASVGEGVFILTMLGAAYGTIKRRKSMKCKE